MKAQSCKTTKQKHGFKIANKAGAWENALHQI